MSQAFLLSREEENVIIAHHNSAENVDKISRLTRRHESTVQRFLQPPILRKPRRTHVPNQHFTDRKIRHIREAALRIKKSSVELKYHLYLKATVRQIRQILCDTPYLSYQQCRPAPFLKRKQFKLRKKWAQAKLESSYLDWKSVVFTDEKD